MPNWRMKLRILLWSTLTLVVGWLLYMAIAPSGNISYSYDFKKSDYFIRKLTPEERVGPVLNGSQVVIGDPVYFALRTPRRFNKATIALTYKNENLPLIEAGVLADKKIWRYQLKPVENKILDQLAASWHPIYENGVMFLQKEKKFNALSDFLNNLPEKNEIALYNYNIKNDYTIKNYKPAENFKKIDFGLRGAWQLFTYIKEEDLNFSFKIIDLNKNKDSDSLDLNLYYAGELIASKHLTDDGIAADSGKASVARDLEIKLAGLPEGVYKMELKANDDIMTKEIITKQNKLSFINKLWIADDNKENFSLFTDSGEISVQTINPGRLQTIRVARRN